MLSNCHDTSMILTGKTDNAGNPEKKPALICAYNQHMGGVDLVDQQLHAIHVLRKQKACGTKSLLFACVLSACYECLQIISKEC